MQELPVEIVTEVMQHVSSEDLLTLESMNERFQTIIQKSPVLRNRIERTRGIQHAADTLLTTYQSPWDEGRVFEHLSSVFGELGTRYQNYMTRETLREQPGRHQDRLIDSLSPAFPLMTPDLKRELFKAHQKDIGIMPSVFIEDINELPADLYPDIVGMVEAAPISIGRTAAIAGLARASMILQHTPGLLDRSLALAEGIEDPAERCDVGKNFARHLGSTSPELDARLLALMTSSEQEADIATGLQFLAFQSPELTDELYNDIFNKIDALDDARYRGQALSGYAANFAILSPERQAKILACVIDFEPVEDKKYLLPNFIENFDELPQPYKQQIVEQILTLRHDEETRVRLIRQMRPHFDDVDAALCTRIAQDAIGMHDDGNRAAAIGALGPVMKRLGEQEIEDIIAAIKDLPDGGHENALLNMLRHARDVLPERQERLFRAAADLPNGQGRLRCLGVIAGYLSAKSSPLWRELIDIAESQPEQDDQALALAGAVSRLNDLAQDIQDKVIDRTLAAKPDTLSRQLPPLSVAIMHMAPEKIDRFFDVLKTLPITEKQWTIEGIFQKEAIIPRSWRERLLEIAKSIDREPQRLQAIMACAN